MCHNWQDLTLTPAKPLEHRGEEIVVKAPRIVLKLEGGAGNKTLPLLVAEVNATAQVKDFSSKVRTQMALPEIGRLFVNL